MIAFLNSIADEFLHIIKKPIITFLLAALLITALTTCVVKLSVDTKLGDVQKTQEIRRLQISYCDSFFSRQTIILTETYPELPPHQIKYCILRCKYDITLRIFYSDIQNSEAYIQNLSKSFLNIVWSENISRNTNPETLELYIENMCKTLVSNLAEMSLL